MNQLQFETSPYLLQHAHNPVEWFAWRPEAFEKAKAEDKPILVSIGYSTCHWCHVMERESFENQDVAALMNEFFVCIKVDREERPDVDAIYMEACQIMSGGGGWPLNCFLTPEGKPFFAGTYFPPRPAYNRPSWTDVLLHFAKVWREQREKVEEQAEKMLGYIRRNDDVFLKKFGLPATPDFSSLKIENQRFTPAYLENLFYRLRDDFDRAEGGFGGAPKFPATMAIQFLLNYHHHTGNPEALEHAEFSLDRMILGGIYDQLGGGFARYATDREWLIPHFEKMLYDNALLVGVLAEAYKLTKKEIYRETIGETLDFIEREMTHPDGGYFSAFDADSEGVEGKFYVWEKSEIEQILGDDADVFCRFYGVSEAGNWEGKNILWREKSFEKFAAGEKKGFQILKRDDIEKLKKTLAACRQKLFEERKKRLPPGLDDKILLGWNALMISAQVAAFQALGNEKHRAAALRNLDFLLKNFADPSSSLIPHSSSLFLHSWKNDRAQISAFLDDLAFLIAALLDVYEISFDASFLKRAGDLTDLVLADFLDLETGLFFYTSQRQTDILLRKKDLYDNATPSGNSTMALNLQKLAVLLDRPDFQKTSERMLETMAETVEKFPRSFERWAVAATNLVYPLREIAVVGRDAHEMASAICSQFLPNRIIVASAVETEDLPLLSGKMAGDGGEVLIYVCQNFACQRPVSSLSELDFIFENG